jgi:hypothetical protein
MNYVNVSIFKMICLIYKEIAFNAFIKSFREIMSQVKDLFDVGQLTKDF